ncbi:MAG: hypothetical protein AAF441_18025, partial [Pseudomonadota bacterium]
LVRLRGKEKPSCGGDRRRSVPQREARFVSSARSRHEVLETILYSMVGIAMVGFYAIGALGVLAGPGENGRVAAAGASVQLKSGGPSVTLAIKAAEPSPKSSDAKSGHSSFTPLPEGSAPQTTARVELSEVLPVRAAALPGPAETDAAAILKQEKVSSPLVSSEEVPSADNPKSAAVDNRVDAAASSLKRAIELVSDGHDLMGRGDVMGARVLFVQGLELGSPEAALALGRSYDPEFLAQMPGANGEGDGARAEAMYREWHRRALAAGTVAPGVKLAKLIQAMRGRQEAR